VAEVYVDGVRLEITETTGTLGDLLRVFDTQATVARHLVTDVRLDGSDEPAFRDPSIVVRPLAAIGRVDSTVATWHELGSLARRRRVNCWNHQTTLPRATWP